MIRKYLLRCEVVYSARCCGGPPRALGEALAPGGVIVAARCDREPTVRVLCRAGRQLTEMAQLKEQVIEGVEVRAAAMHPEKMLAPGTGLADQGCSDS